jgi:hypothetical protein
VNRGIVQLAAIELFRFTNRQYGQEPNWLLRMLDETPGTRGVPL